MDFKGESPSYDDCLNKCLEYNAGTDDGQPTCNFFTHDYKAPGGDCYLYASCPALTFGLTCPTCISGESETLVGGGGQFRGLKDIT